MVDYRPVSSALNSGGPLEFIIPPSSNQYINLKRSKIFLKVKIVHADGSNPGLLETAAPVNWLVQTLFSQVELYLQSTLVSGSAGNMHPYRCMFELLLDSSNDSKLTSLQSGLFYKDTAYKMDDVGTESQNDGYNRRISHCAMGTVFELIGPIVTDLAQQSRVILNATELHFKFWPGKSAFHLMCGPDSSKEDFRVEIVDACLKICKLTPLPSITLAHSQALEVSPALYPYMRSEIRALQLMAGSYSFSFEDVFSSSVPAVVVLGMVTSEAYSGSYQKNPFAFVNQGLSSLSVHLDDFPVSTIKTRFTTGLSGDDVARYQKGYEYLQGYESLFQSTAEEVEAGGFCNITRREYSGGYTLFVYRIGPGHHPEFLPTVSSGNLRIQGNFEKALLVNTTMLVYGRFASLLTIDKARNVTV
jgi:ribonucleoside-diphosphate reductase beta chain